MTTVMFFAFVFISANPLRLEAIIVERCAVLISFNRLKLCSHSQEVIGKVNASCRRTEMLENVMESHAPNTSISLFGLSLAHFKIHIRYSLGSITG